MDEEADPRAQELIGFLVELYDLAAQVDPRQAELLMLQIGFNIRAPVTILHGGCSYLRETPEEAGELTDKGLMLLRMMERQVTMLEEVTVALAVTRQDEPPDAGP